MKFCSETFASLFTCCGSSKLLDSFVAEDFFVFELGVEYVLASVQYSYKSRQQTLRTSTKLMSTQHTASFVVAVKELVNEYIMSGPYVILSYLEAVSSSDCDTTE